MKVHFVKATIERDPMEKIPVCVPATALPILQLVHGGNVHDVRVQDDYKDVDPEQEYERLESLYGERKGTGRSFAEEVYGSAHGMVRRMSLDDDRVDSQPAQPGDVEDEPTSIFGDGEAEEEEQPAPVRRRRNG